MFNNEMSEAVLMTDELESLIPVRDQILIMPDRQRETSTTGIILPETARQPVFRGRVLAVSYFVSRQWEAAEIPPMHQLAFGDRVVFHWIGAMPQSTSKDLSPILISVNNVLAKVKKEKKDADARIASNAGVS